MRPHLLDEINKREVLAVVSFGVSRNAAAGYVGCAPNTLRNEMRRDETFRESLLAAERNCETLCLQNIREAGAKHWRAAAWLLEKRFPKRYGKLAEKLARDKAERKQARRGEQARRAAPTFDSVNREYVGARLEAVEQREADVSGAIDQLNSLREDLLRRDLEVLAMEARSRAMGAEIAAEHGVRVDGKIPNPADYRAEAAEAEEAARHRDYGYRQRLHAARLGEPDAGAFVATRYVPAPSATTAVSPPGATAVSAVRSSPTTISAARTAAAAVAVLLFFLLLVGQIFNLPSHISPQPPRIAQATQPQVPAIPTPSSLTRQITIPPHEDWQITNLPHWNKFTPWVLAQMRDYVPRLPGNNPGVCRDGTLERWRYSTARARCTARPRSR